MPGARWSGHGLELTFSDMYKYIIMINRKAASWHPAQLLLSQVEAGGKSPIGAHLR